VSVDVRCCDARDGLRTINDGTVDLIVIDPPYRTISGGNASSGRPTGVLAANDGRLMRHNDIDASEYAHELFRVLRDQSHCYVMTNLVNLWHFRDVFLQTGFKLHNLLIWHKNNATPNRWYMKNCEYVLMFRKGAVKSINDCGSKTVHQFDNSFGNRDHPTQKPVGLMKYYIENSSQPGDTVMDCFMGAGSTAVAAMVTGRKFIGFEIDPEYYVKACSKLKRMP
jgi:site-specific DNA-methyltransferase (adenine-specific)